MCQLDLSQMPDSYSSVEMVCPHCRANFSARGSNVYIVAASIKLWNEHLMQCAAHHTTDSHKRQNLWPALEGGR